MTEDKNNPVKNFTDLLDSLSEVAGGVEDLVDEHGDAIRNITGDVEEVNLADDSVLKDAIVREEFVEVVITYESEGLDSIGMKRVDESIVLHIGDNELKADVPEDANIDEAESRFKNGILTVRIPRGGELEWD